MNKENKVKATCKNCGCPDTEERHDHYWCDWCGNEMKKMREAANKIKLDM